MIKLNYNGKEYQMTTDWEEMSLGQFLNITKIQQKNEIISLGEEMLAQQLIEALCGVELGDFDEMTLKQIQELATHLKDLQDKWKQFEKKEYQIPKSWEINGRIYSYRHNYNECTAGEITDIKSYIGEKQNEWEYMADVAAVLIRPATLNVTESGIEYFQLSKRHPLDHEHNKKVVLGMSFLEVSKIVSFFLSGWLKQMLGMSDSTELGEEVLEAVQKYQKSLEH